MPKTQHSPDQSPLVSSPPHESKGKSLAYLSPAYAQEGESGETSGGSSSDLVHVSRDASRQPSPLATLSHPDIKDSRSREEYRGSQKDSEQQRDSDSEEDLSSWGDAGPRDYSHLDEEEEAMPSDMRAHAHSRSMNNHSQHSQPLLAGDKQSGYEHSQSPSLHRRRSARFRERDPEQMAKAATKKRYTYAACFLGLSLITFAIQTETAVYIQHNLHWNKAYCMLYLTHGSWSLLWPAQLLILRLQKWNQPWPQFWRRHLQILRQTGQMVQHQQLHLSPSQQKQSPVPYFIRTTAFVTCALTVAGGSWYVAVDLTTASDLTAIYNCSAFFAYAFAVPMLGEKLRVSKVVAVAIAIVGVLVVAYGDKGTPKHGSKSGGGSGGAHAPEDDEAENRALGNIVIGVGSVLYGFYEVLYKRVACPPEGCAPEKGMIFANTFGSLIGCFTLLVLWIPIPILHFLGWETFALPTGKTAWILLVSVTANATFSGSFLVLISLTSPVLSSVAALLTIFLVALCDQLLPPPLHTDLTFAAIVGGLLIIGAFLMLSWATYREMSEEKKKHAEEIVEHSESEDEDV